MGLISLIRLLGHGREVLPFRQILSRLAGIVLSPRLRCSGFQASDYSEPKARPPCNTGVQAYVTPLLATFPMVWTDFLAGSLVAYLAANYSSFRIFFENEVAKHCEFFPFYPSPLNLQSLHPPTLTPQHPTFVTERCWLWLWYKENGISLNGGLYLQLQLQLSSVPECMWKALQITVQVLELIAAYVGQGNAVQSEKGRTDRVLSTIPSTHARPNRLRVRQRRLICRPWAKPRCTSPRLYRRVNRCSATQGRDARGGNRDGRGCCEPASGAPLLAPEEVARVVDEHVFDAGVKIIKCHTQRVELHTNHEPRRRSVRSRWTCAQRCCL